MQAEIIQANQTNSIINQRSWWGKFVALIAVANLLLVLFNFSYLPLRDFYFHKLPAVVRVYDPIRNIEAHPDTTRYLRTVDLLKAEIIQTGLESVSSQNLLADLRQQSEDMLLENPFSVANKFATFAKLKGRMEYHLDTSSTQNAFAQFWSREYLQQVTPGEALAFFERKIRPLLEVNYYRTVDENGQFLDEFWRVDLCFAVFFALELLIRSWFVARKKLGISWGDVLLRRWYDGLMILPFWRWLRIIPVSVKLHQSGLTNMERILAQITHEPAAYLADRTSVFLLVRLINQTKEAVETGAVARALLEPQEYIQVSDVNKLDAISDRLLELSIYKVLPNIQPDVELLLHHTLKEALQQSDFYQGLQGIPGLDVLPLDVTEQLADYLAQSVYEILVSSYSDLEGRELFENLVRNFKKSLSEELRKEETQSELQLLLSQLLEELKLNYVQSSQNEDPTQTLSEVEQLEEIKQDQNNLTTNEK